MPKEIKKFYNYMNLSYSSSIDEVKDREKVMIKILRAKAIKKGKSCNNQIQQVVNYANQIIDYIEKNGVSEIKDNLFDTPKNSIFTQFFILISLVAVLVCSIFALI